MGERHRPLRTCIGCRRVADPEELVRVARRPDGEIVAGRAEPGRGAWLCAAKADLAHSEQVHASCFDMAVRRSTFRRALRCEVSAYVTDRLRGELVAGPAGGDPGR